MVKQNKRTAILALSDGSIFEGFGFGCATKQVGEVCFNTAMTGYQEIMSDPSYAGQMVCFTFPHIGIVGTNGTDMESEKPVIKGVIVKDAAQDAANYRATESMDSWLTQNKIPGISGIDTRRLTLKIRRAGFLNGVLHSDAGHLSEKDRAALVEEAKGFKGIQDQDLATEVSEQLRGENADIQPWQEGTWFAALQANRKDKDAKEQPHVVVIDYGCKHNILRILIDCGCRVTKVSPFVSAAQILALNPSGILLSNGPGDPKATGEKVLPTIQKLIESNLPLLGICLGHQMLALALGLQTQKMKVGHHGANHPVYNHISGKVKITSQNHGFDVVAGDAKSGKAIEWIERSLFDKSVAAFQVKDKPIFAVQYHPEASPGPRESTEIFQKFLAAMQA